MEAEDEVEVAEEEAEEEAGAGAFLEEPPEALGVEASMAAEALEGEVGAGGKIALARRGQKGERQGQAGESGGESGGQSGESSHPTGKAVRSRP